MASTQNIAPLARIRYYTHFFTVEPLSSRVIGVLFNYLQEYIEKVWFQERGSKPRLIPGKVYASRTIDNREFRLHLGQLKGFLDALLRYGVDDSMIESIYMSRYTPKNHKFKLANGRELRDYQIDAREFAINSGDIDFNSALIAMPTGSGKAQSLNSHIKIPGGWATMGSMKVGTEVVAWDGTTTTVKGVYPQGIKDNYRITFSDGRTAEACGEHLWKVYCDDQEKILTTLQIRELLEGGTKCYIPKFIPGEELEIDLPMAASAIGIQIANRCSEESAKDRQIPVEYLNASRTQRYDLLRGLMITGHYAVYDDYTYFRCSSEQLAKDFQYLVWSLGGTAKLSKDQEGGLYKVDILSEDGYSFWDWVRPHVYNKVIDAGGRLEITKVEYVGQEEMQCISIDHPDKLYVTDNFVVTHNTVTLCGVAESIGQNLAIAVLPRYMEKWGGDLVENLALKKKDIMMVSGSKQVKGLIHMVKHGEKPPFATIFSLVTLQNFFDTYEQDPKLCLEEYGCIPQDIWKLLGIGLVGVDEAHEHLYSVFRLTLHLHGPKLVALSGTMLSEDFFIEKIQKTIFPHSVRYDKIKMKKYIKLMPMAYEFADMRRYKIRTSSFGRTTYSQVEYEKSILKNPHLLHNYISMIKDVVDMGYIDGKMEGDKAAIYCGSIEMCTRVTNYLKQCYPKLDVRRYVEQDPYKNVIEADIRVTTIISAGTAVDIPNLRTLINTNNISSQKANIQTLGRLRELKDRDVKMYYLYCEQIPKHVQYHHQRMELYEERVASIHCLKLPHKL